MHRADGHAKRVRLHIHLDLGHAAYRNALSGGVLRAGAQGARAVDDELGAVWQAVDAAEAERLRRETNR